METEPTTEKTDFNIKTRQGTRSGVDSGEIWEHPREEKSKEMNHLRSLPDRIKYFKDKHLNNGKWPDHIMFAVDTLKTIEAGEQPLLLGQFIPCLNGKPLEKPEYFYRYMTSSEAEQENYSDQQIKEFGEFHEAKKDVLFKGWELHEYQHPLYCHIINSEELVLNFSKISGNAEWDKYPNPKTIEDIADLNLELTEKGKKELI